MKIKKTTKIKMTRWQSFRLRLLVARDVLDEARALMDDEAIVASGQFSDGRAAPPRLARGRVAARKKFMSRLEKTEDKLDKGRKK